MRSTILGFVAALVVLYFGVVEINSLKMIINKTGLIIVLGGTIAAGSSTTYWNGGWIIHSVGGGAGGLIGKNIIL